MPSVKNKPRGRAVFDEAARHHRAGRLADAVTFYERALVARPNHPEAHNNLGAALEDLGRIDEGLAHYERALVLKPDYPDAHNNLGARHAAQGKFIEAIAHYQCVVALRPNDARAHHNLAMVFAAHGRTADALTHYRCALALDPKYPDAHNNLGVLLAAEGKLDEAVGHYRRALALKPDLADTHSNLGVALVERGEIDEALRHYERAITIDPANSEAHYNRAEIRTFKTGDTDFGVLEVLAARKDLPEKTKPLPHFALAKALEDIGEYPRAFEHLRTANELKRRQVHYDEAAVLSFFNRVSETFDRGLIERLAGKGDPSEVPIFVLGMPRSGSTLVEQILASHPLIHGAGELPELGRAIGRYGPYPECMPGMDGDVLCRIAQTYLGRLPVAPAGKIRIVDKLPDNFIAAGLIRLILPNARIIHTVRHPVDTCVSCYSRRFTTGQNFSYDLAELGRYYRHYSELMGHWRSVLPSDAILDLAYEDVVEDLEGQARRLIEYCGVPWDDRCLDFYKTNRSVKTASSIQVRRPLFCSSLNRWRRYEPFLGPLLKELGDLASGYESRATLCL